MGTDGLGARKLCSAMFSIRVTVTGRYLNCLDQSPKPVVRLECCVEVGAIYAHRRVPTIVSISYQHFGFLLLALRALHDHLLSLRL